MSKYLLGRQAKRSIATLLPSSHLVNAEIPGALQ